jgi:hypothetical protein
MTFFAIKLQKDINTDDSLRILDALQGDAGTLLMVYHGSSRIRQRRWTHGESFSGISV